MKEDRLFIMPKIKLLIFFASALAIATSLQAALVVQLGQAKTTGSKAIIKLDLENTFDTKIQAARAVVFLTDDQGKVVGQSTRWIIGGSNDRPALESKAKTTFNFVVPTEKPFTKTQFLVERVLLEGNKPADIRKEVVIKESAPEK